MSEEERELVERLRELLDGFCGSVSQQSEDDVAAAASLIERLAAERDEAMQWKDAWEFLSRTIKHVDDLRTKQPELSITTPAPSPDRQS